MDLRTCGPDAEKAVKELLYVCAVSGIRTKMREPRAMPTKTTDTSMHHYSANRYVITFVQEPSISSVALKAAFDVIAARSVNIVRMDRLSEHLELTALQLTVIMPRELDAKDFFSELRRVSRQQGADVAIQRDDVDRWMRRMVVFDMKILVQQDVAMEMAKVAGVEDETSTILEATARGE